MKKIALSGKFGKGKFALVCDCHYDLIAGRPWQLSEGGYVYYMKHTDQHHTKYVSMHRLIMELPRNMEVDHEDNDKLNNQCDNLRPSTREQNARNVAPRRDNKSGYKGVSWFRYKWASRITIDRKLRHLGYFDTPEQAAAAYNSAALEHYGEFAWLNQIEEAPISR